MAQDKSLCGGDGGVISPQNVGMDNSVENRNILKLLSSKVSIE